MYLQGSGELSGMTFSGNRAGSTGGGLYSCAPLTLEDSALEGNSAGYDGGGLCTAIGHRPVVSGCTFTGNTVLFGKLSAPTFFTLNAPVFQMVWINIQNFCICLRSFFKVSIV